MTSNGKSTARVKLHTGGFSAAKPCGYCWFPTGFCRSDTVGLVKTVGSDNGDTAAITAAYEGIDTPATATVTLSQPFRLMVEPIF